MSTEYPSFGDLPHERPDGGESNFGMDPNSPGYWQGFELASWTKRMVSAFVDYFPVYLIAAKDGDTGLFALLILIANTVVLQARTGQSVGKMLVGTQLVAPYSQVNNPGHFSLIRPSYLTLALRQLAHLVDISLGIGILTMAFSKRRQNIADMIVNTICIPKDDSYEQHIGTMEQAEANGFTPLERAA